jgi:hypothetical protein
MQRPASADFGGELALRGFDLSAESVRPGEVIRLKLYWQALRQPSRNYTVFTHLLGPGNKVVGQQDSQPLRGQAPTLGWAAGQVVADEYELRLDPDAAGDEVAIEVGLYDAPTGARLRLAGGDADFVILARLPVARR